MGKIDTAQPDYCSISTIAGRLDCSETAVRNYTDRGLIPRPRKIGGMVRWKWSEVEQMWDNMSPGSQVEQDPILRAINGT